MLCFCWTYVCTFFQASMMSESYKYMEYNNKHARLRLTSSVATVQTGVFANLSNKIAKFTENFENVDEAKTERSSANISG
jgi:hypothetical protein